jgi:hypothetical protein
VPPRAPTSPMPDLQSEAGLVHRKVSDSTGRPGPGRSARLHLRDEAIF